jgi:hypothetical protein
MYDYNGQKASLTPVAKLTFSSPAMRKQSNPTLQTTCRVLENLDFKEQKKKRRVGGQGASNAAQRGSAEK